MAARLFPWRSYFPAEFQNMVNQENCTLVRKPDAKYHSLSPPVNNSLGYIYRTICCELVSVSLQRGDVETTTSLEPS